MGKIQNQKTLHCRHCWNEVYKCVRTSERKTESGLKKKSLAFNSWRNNSLKQIDRCYLAIRFLHIYVCDAVQPYYFQFISIVVCSMLCIYLYVYTVSIAFALYRLKHLYYTVIRNYTMCSLFIVLISFHEHRYISWALTI